MTWSWLNWPNRISLARILLVPPLVICLLNLNSSWTGARHAALALYVAMALSDALDGFLARVLHQESELGKLLDPVADKLLTTCAVIILAIDATSVPGAVLPSWVPVIALGKDVLTVVGFGLLYVVTGRVFIRPRVFGKACTLIQSVMLAATLLYPDLPAGLGSIVPLTWYVASAAAVLALLDYVREGVRFASECDAGGAS